MRTSILFFLINLIMFSCANKSKKSIDTANISTLDTVVEKNSPDKKIALTVADDTTRNSDGLYIPMSLIKIAVGQWTGEPIPFPINKYNITKVIFNYLLNDDASGNLNIRVIVNENNSPQELSLFFHIYPWGIANNRNNENMLYIHLEKGILQESTVINKKTEASIKAEFLNLIEKSKGFSAEISKISQNTISVKQIEPTGIYPKTLTRVE